jgi:hypothetical protein
MNGENKLMKTKRIISFLVFSAGILSALPLSAADSSRPNILWIIIDDMSANFSSYGETLIDTPHVDKLTRNIALMKQWAAEGK